MRTVASQMEDARGADRHGPDRRDRRATARTPSSRRRHRDHVPRLPAAYVEGRDEEQPRTPRSRSAAAAARRGRARSTSSASSRRATRRRRRRATPRRRSSSALEELGIGRPSTYASIISTIVDRGYVWKKGTALVPTCVAFAVISCSSSTSAGSSTTTSPRAWRTTSTASPPASRSAEWLQRFYYGERRPERQPGLKELVIGPRRHRRRAVNTIPLGEAASSCASAATGRSSSAATSARRVPPDIAPDELTRREGRGAAGAPLERPVARRRPETGRASSSSDGRCGPYVTEVLPEGDEREAADGVAARRRWRPRRHARAGAAAAVAAARVGRVGRRGGRRATNGRYGPYIQKGDGDALARERGAALHDHARRGARAARAAEDARPAARRQAAAAGARRRPGRAASRSSSRTAASARTSPTARRTRACAAATASRR